MREREREGVRGAEKSLKGDEEVKAE